MAIDKKDENLEKDKVSVGGKIALFFILLAILIIWLGIIALLIKSDVGRFGSTVLYPKWKDIPVLNLVLPEVSPVVEDEYAFDSIDDAVRMIQQLEQQIAQLKVSESTNLETIDALQAQVEELSKYKQEQENFETIRDKFYEDVLYYTTDEYDLYSQKSTVVLEAYRQYFEEIEPAKAEELYKQTVTQLENADQMDDYVNRYSNMKPKNAAAIFDEMCGTPDGLQTVADILNHMAVQSAADILAAMDTKNAANVTFLLKPELR